MVKGLSKVCKSVISFARLATSPSFAYVSNPAQDSSLQSCCSPIASTSAAAPLLHPTAAPCLHPLQLLFPDCFCFHCCSPIASISAAAPRLCLLQLLLPDCVHFSCCSPIVSASTAPQMRPLQLLLPDCVRFNCCSPIVSASTAAPQWHPLVAPAILEVPSVLEHSSRSSRSRTKVAHH